MEFIISYIKICFKLCFILAFYNINVYALSYHKGVATFKNIDNYDLCHSKYESSVCDQALRAWVKKNPSDSFQAGKLTRKKMNAWGALYFFDLASKNGILNCSDADVKMAVLSGLSQPAENRKTVIDQALNIGVNKCEKDLMSDILDHIKSDDVALKNSCTSLKKKNVLKGMSAKKCSKI